MSEIWTFVKTGTGLGRPSVCPRLTVLTTVLFERSFTTMDSSNRSVVIFVRLVPCLS